MSVDVTVCICTHNRPSYLRDCLEGLRRQTVGLDRFSILVADSASDRAVSAQISRMVAAIPNGRMVRVERPGVGLARNARLAWRVSCALPSG